MHLIYIFMSKKKKKRKKEKEKKRTKTKKCKKVDRKLERAVYAKGEPKERMHEKMQKVD